MFKKLIILGFMGFAITAMTTSCQNNKKCEETCEHKEGAATDSTATASMSTDSTGGEKACCKGGGATCSKEEKEACEKGGEQKECCKNKGKENEKETMVEPK